MKTSLTKLKSSLSLALVLLTLPVLAKPVAQVTELGGQVFVISPDGKTKSLKINDHIEDKSEVLVDEGATITLNDYYDATYHMIGGTHVKFFDKSLQLKRGKTWIQSQSSKFPLDLTTANGHVNFKKGEFITTFDLATSRTQVLVVNGEVDVANILDANLQYTVAAGSFSLIDPEVDDGSPRTPVKVGLHSLNTALAEFKKLPEKIKESTPVEGPSRAVASVEPEAQPTVKKGEIIFMTAGRAPASVSGEALKYFKKKAAPSLRKSQKKEGLTQVEIKYYGMSWKPVVSVTTSAAPMVLAPRQPASIESTPSYTLPKNLTKDVMPDTEFGASLKKHSEEQPKYSKELDTLIQDLKSY
jgi:hypothetical protein